MRLQISAGLVLSLPLGLFSKVTLRPSVATVSIILSLTLVSPSLALIFLYSTHLTHRTFFLFILLYVSPTRMQTPGGQGFRIALFTTVSQQLDESLPMKYVLNG